MKYWSRYPVFRFLIPFSVGILTGMHRDLNLLAVILIAVFSLVISFWFTYRNLATGKYAQRWLAGIPFYCCFFMLGHILCWFYQSKNFSEHFSASGQGGIVLMELTETPVKTLKGYRIIGKVTAIKNKNEWNPSRGNIMVFVADSLSGITANPGDKMIFKTNWKNIPPPTNPGAFNYAAFMVGKGVWHQGFVAGNQYRIVEKKQQASIFSMAASMRILLLQKLQNYIPDKDQLGVAGALLLGYDDWLDPELENHYAATGVLHILCVSGMHVGLIYMIFSWLLVWMERKPGLRHIRFALLIFLIWFYAMVTGLAPSVIRASTMLTFVIAGKWMNKNTNIYNTLCGSCMLMFAINPFLIMSAGFQLSFLAVCGIVFFQRLILSLWEAPTNLLHKAWELISVSVSAQLATSPLSIFLFHQFPNYFILGNLFIIPLIPVVMYSGLSLFAAGWIPYAGMVAGTAVSITIELINIMVVFFGTIPGAVTTNIHLSFKEMLLLYLLIIFSSVWLVRKSCDWLFVSMVTLILLFGIQTHILFQAKKQHVLTVYDSGSNSLLSIIKGQQATVIMDPETDEKVLRYSLEGHLLQSIVSEKKLVKTDDNILLYLKSSNAFHIKNLTNNRIFDKRQVKFLILGGYIKSDVNFIIDNFHPEMVVFDASCKRWQVTKLEEELKSAGINTYDVKKQGAFQIHTKFNPLSHLEERFLSFVHLYR